MIDAQRPSVVVRTTPNIKTRERNILVLVKFAKPVIDFNSSAAQIYGGRLLRQVLLCVTNAIGNECCSFV